MTVPAVVLMVMLGETWGWTWHPTRTPVPVASGANWADQSVASSHASMS